MHEDTKLPDLRHQRKTARFYFAEVRHVPLFDNRRPSLRIFDITHGFMGYSLGRGILWLVIYLALALIPMAVALLDAPPARTFWVEFGVALGFIGLSMMALQFLFTGRFRRVAPEFGTDNILQYHRDMGIIGFLFVLAHPIVLFLADPAFLAYLDPRVNALRAVSLSFATVAVIAIVVTTLWRKRMRLNYEWWRLVHGGLSLAVVFIGLVHAFRVDHYLDPFWKKAFFTLAIGGGLYLIIHTRLVRPWLMKKRPYRVAEVLPERGDSWTLIVEPDGHEGLSFKQGQFAWTTVGETPYRLQQHPFSFSSSARDPKLSFTAKELGDFTASWRHIEPGTKMFLEGPLGSFTPDPSPGAGLFLIMGGIGITPGMSILRTMRDDNDRRPVILLYANVEWEQVTFREEIDELGGILNLKTVHILEEPPEDWSGETGLITRELLDKYLPDDPNSFQYFICGPKPMMNIVEVALRELGVEWRLVYTERFEIV